MCGASLPPLKPSEVGENIPTNMVPSSTLHGADVKYNELDVKDKAESSSCSEDSSSSDDTSSSDLESEDGDIVEEFNKLDFGDLLLSSAQRVNLRKLFKPGEFESLCRFDQKRISRIENKLTLALRLDLPLPHEDIIREKIGLPRQISHPLEASDSDSDAESSRYPTLLRGLSGDETAARMSFIAKYCEERESGKRIVCQKMKRKKVLKPTEPQRIVVDEKPKFEAFKEVSRYRTRGTRNIPYAEPYLPEDDHFVYCEDCQKSFLDDCPDHPLTIMKDSDAKEGSHDYARRTCPPGLSIDPSSVYNAGYGVWADVAVPKNTVFGPYEGCIVGRYDVKHLMKVCSGGYSWEVYKKSKLSHYIDGSDASKSNWMRFINCARYQEEQNLVAFQYRGEIYYRSFCDIKPNTEMFVWYGSQFASQLGIQGSLKQKFCPATSNESAISEPVSRDQQGYGTEILDNLKSDHADVKDNSCSPRRQSEEKSYSDFAMQGHTVVAKDEELTTQPVLQMTPADQIPFKCDTCGRKFRRRDALTYHIRTHTGERPFKCEICGFRFNRKGGLTAHKMIHTGEKPFKCKICGARFRRRDGLASHRVTHTGVKPFKCDKCGSGFFRKDGLKNHKRIHTDCGAIFSDGRDLQCHERTDTASDIVREIQGQLIMEKRLATFTAEVESDGITGYWTKDGVVLQCSEKFQILSEHRVRQLIIINVCEDDSGEYSFHTGRSKTSGKITVQAVGIKSQLEPVTIKETQTAVFECMISHMDITSNVNCWTKNGSRIQNTDRISTNVEGNKHTLSIRDCTTEDSGHFAFHIGKDKSEAKLEVKAVDIVRKLEGQLIMVKRCATFTAEVETDGITGYWTKDGVVLQSSEKFQMHVERRVHQLTIGNICENDSGIYSFHAGGSKTSGRLTVQAVSITSQIKPVTIKETQTAVFECIISHPDITSHMNYWTKNGTRIQNTDRISTNVQGCKHTLSIRDCTTEDSGQYAFQVGKDKSEAKLHVQAIDIARELQGQFIMEKKLAIFTAEVDNDGITGYWTKDGVVLQISDKFQMQVERRVHQLTIANVCENDAGEYFFHAGRSKTSGRLTVQTVSIKSQLKPVTIKETQTAVFECTVSHPDIMSNTTYWTKDKSQIQNTDRISTNAEGYKHTLTIRDCTVEDTGQYVFQVGKDKSQAKLYVHAMDIVRELRDQHIMEERRVVFTAEVDIDGITGYWMKDGVALQSSERFQMQVERRVYHLTISNVCKNDEGEYSFHAGRSKTSGRLTVYTINIDSQLKPVTVKETQTAFLGCTVSHQDITPNMKYWTKNGSQIQNTDRISTNAEGYKQSLTIRDCTAEDSGEYAFQVGKNKSQAMLHVQAVNIARKLQGKFIMAKRMAIFTTELDYYGITGYWTKDGVVLQSSGKYQMRVERRVHKLTIVNVCENDAGVYFFHAGSSKTSAKLAVQMISIKSQLEMVSVKETQTAVFECTVSHPDITPNMNYWTKNGSLIQNTGRISTNVKGYKHTLSIRNCAAEDSGLYAFQVGKDKSEARLFVQAIDTAREHHHVIERRLATFTAKVYSNGITGYWTKNGVLVQNVIPSERFQIQSNWRANQLSIGNVYENNLGQYPFHTRGYVPSGRFLQQAVCIRTQIQPVIIKGTRTVVFECSVSHTNILRHMYCWTKNGEAIQDSYRISANVEAYRHTLRIRDCTAEDSGRYAFQVCDDITEARLDVQVLSLAKIDNVKLEENSEIKQGSAKYITEKDDRRCSPTVRDVSQRDTGACSFVARSTNTSGRMSGEATGIVRDLQDQHIMENGLATFTAEVANDGITGYWTKDGVVLHTSDKCQIQSQSLVRKLTICNVCEYDAGEYSFHTGQSKTSGRLTVQAVTIKSQIKPVTIKETQTVVFESRVSHPNITSHMLRWTKNGSQIQKTNRISTKVEGCNHALSIRDCTTEDSGQYGFHAGRFKSAAKLDVQAIVIIRGIQDQEVTEKRCATFTAVLNDAGITGYWTKDGVVLEPSNKHQIKCERGMHQLSIVNACKTDAAEYSFHAGKYKTSGRLTVHGVTIESHIKPVTIKETHTAVFQCTVSRKDIALKTNRWTKNGIRIKNTDRISTRMEGYKHTLTIRDCTTEDTGLYMFRVVRATSEAKLDVQAIMIIRELQDQHIMEKGLATFTAELDVDGITGYWTKDGRVLQSTGKYQIQSGQRVHQLAIGNVSEYDSDVYSFHAGKSKTSGRLTVQAVSIKSQIDPVSIKETETAVLKCTVSLNALNTNRWTKNKSQIQNTDRISTNVQGCKHTLTIQDRTTEDSGQHAFQVGKVTSEANLDVQGIKLSNALENICVTNAANADFTGELSRQNINVKWELDGDIKHDGAKYLIGKDDQRCRLTVGNVTGCASSSGRIYAGAIDIIRELRDQHIMENRLATFTTEVANDGINGYWAKDGMFLQSSEKFQTKCERRLRQLTIGNVCENDSGEYSFHSGIFKTSGRLTVQTVSITSQIKPVIIKDTGAVVFECKVTHPDIPSNMYCWIKDGSRIQNTDRISTNVEGFKHSLSIRNCTAEDSGRYSFQVGKDKSKTKLDVQGENPFGCEICGATFSQRHHLQQHKVTHTGYAISHFEWNNR